MSNARRLLSFSSVIMLFQVTVAIIMVLSNVESTIILQDLTVIANIKSNVHELKETLAKFRHNMTSRMEVFTDSLWENRKDDEPPEDHMKRMSCTQIEVQKAKMESKKLLNMLVEGETNMLAICESTLVNFSVPIRGSDLQQLYQVWGSLAARGQSRETISAEMNDFEIKMKDRFEDVRRKCSAFFTENTTKGTE